MSHSTAGRFLRDNGLALVLLAAFVVSLAGMHCRAWPSPRVLHVVPETPSHVPISRSACPTAVAIV